MNPHALLALLAGAAIATQASMNARLGVLLQSSLSATAIAFGMSCLFTLTVLALVGQHHPGWQAARAVPLYLWFSGGMLAATGVGLFYFLIPKMGIGPMMSYALTGQLLIAVISSHFGWFELPLKPFTMTRLFGVAALVVGTVLINRD